MKVRIDEVELRGKRVFLRVDFNVPFKDGSIEDDSRIRAALATMKRLRQEGAKTVLATHLGRPKASGDPEFSTQKVLPRVNELMGGGVGYVGAITGEEVEERKAALKPGEFLLLENVRYDSGETKNDPRLAQSWRRTSMSMSTTLSAAPIGPTVRSSGSAGSFPSRSWGT